jgi:hypothetical protein
MKNLIVLLVGIFMLGSAFLVNASNVNAGSELKAVSDAKGVTVAKDKGAEAEKCPADCTSFCYGPKNTCF